MVSLLLISYLFFSAMALQLESYEFVIDGDISQHFYFFIEAHIHIFSVSLSKTYIGMPILNLISDGDR